MHKIISSAIILTSLSITNAYAKATYCNYHDHFHLGKNSPVSLHITSVSSDNNIIVKQLDATRFDLVDVPSCPPEGGTAHVTYSLDASHYCQLIISDSEAKNDPDITVDCKGLAYNGWTYDGFLTWSYTLNFSSLS